MLWRIPCSECNVTGERVDKHDAYACPKCKRWLEPVCLDETCGYCKDRPADADGLV